jgi:putative endonuclease
MVFCKGFTDYYLAIEWEARIKKWSRRKKDALIESKSEDLKVAAACKNESSHLFYDKGHFSTSLEVTDFQREIK